MADATMLYEWDVGEDVKNIIGCRKASDYNVERAQCIVYWSSQTARCIRGCEA